MKARIQIIKVTAKQPVLTTGEINYKKVWHFIESMKQKHPDIKPCLPFHALVDHVSTFPLGKMSTFVL